MKAQPTTTTNSLSIGGCELQVRTRSRSQRVRWNPYKTCGIAYVIEKDRLPKKKFVLSKEDKLLITIEANLDRKNDYLDTMPEFTSVEKRLIDLNERKLHPLYKKYQGVSSKLLLEIPRLCDCPDDFSHGLPKTFAYNAKVLNDKNICFHYKRTQPPDLRTKHLLELRRRQKPEPPPPPEPEIMSPLIGKPKKTYDSLYQENFEF
ncbi:hypothetical protein FQR65_LT16170 [Abscondita terminalis]|nr:hypothetical protein FQR65_LT16170 [Abscondita terminalis]